jgi:hypothetical protein
LWDHYSYLNSKNMAIYGRPHIEDYFEYKPRYIHNIRK